MLFTDIRLPIPANARFEQRKVRQDYYLYYRVSSYYDTHHQRKHKRILIGKVCSEDLDVNTHKGTKFFPNKNYYEFFKLDKPSFSQLKFNGRFKQHLAVTSSSKLKGSSTFFPLACVQILKELQIDMLLQQLLGFEHFNAFIALSSYLASGCPYGRDYFAYFMDANHALFSPDGQHLAFNFEDLLQAVSADVIHNFFYSLSSRCKHVTSDHTSPQDVVLSTLRYGLFFARFYITKDKDKIMAVINQDSDSKALIADIKEVLALDIAKLYLSPDDADNSKMFLVFMALMLRYFFKYKFKSDSTLNTLSFKALIGLMMAIDCKLQHQEWIVDSKLSDTQYRILSQLQMPVYLVGEGKLDKKL